jgi:AcrR family transcriptional regulator
VNGDVVKTPAKEQLIAAAQGLFSARGYSAVSTREIADAAGVNLAAIQYHFGSKAQLFLATIDKMIADSTCSQSQICPKKLLESTEDVDLALKSFIQEFLRYLLDPKQPHPCRVMFREVFLDELETQEIRAKLVETFLEKYMQPMFEAVTSLIQRANPALSKRAAGYIVNSIIGQCSFYASHQPFLEEMGGCDVGKSPVFEEIVEHIYTFTKKGMA